MARRVLIVLLLGAFSLVVAAEPSIDDLVKIYNPNLYAGVEAPMTSTFNAPASDIAKDVLWDFWFGFLVFLPFLILPQILLVYVIVKFRDRKDGRKAATWVHNMPLEIMWTAVPIVALIIVAIPSFPLLYKMELPPAGPEAERALVLTVVGKQFSWEYDYKKEGVNLGSDLVSGIQEPVIMEKGRIVRLHITSNDVNHAWWVPAFGVKKDAVMGRTNGAWFTPDRTGFFKGQCAELCGFGHGKMIIGAVVVESDQFDLWVSLQSFRNPAKKVWDAALAYQPNGEDAGLRASVVEFRERTGGGNKADFALRYWMAHNSVSYGRAAPTRTDDAEASAKAFADWQANVNLLEQRKNKVGALLAAIAAADHGPATTIVAGKE